MKDSKSAYIGLAIAVVIAIAYFVNIYTSKPYNGPYCPVCFSDLENENQADPEYALEWLLNTGYLSDYLRSEGYIASEDLYGLFYDDPEMVSDLLWDDDVLNYLRNHGWTITEPKQ